jgi:hypothetical protein
MSEDGDKKAKDWHQAPHNAQYREKKMQHHHFP